MIYRIVSFLIILSMFSCKHDLERANPLDPNSPYYKPPSIQILAPNGGEEFEVGTSNTISWTSTKVDKVNIELLKNNNIHDVLDSDIENTNSYVWDISSNTNVDTDYKVRVTSSNNSEVYDESNSVFTITEDPQPGNITITSPTLNDNWLLGSSHDVIWTVTNITGTMSINLFKDGSFFKSIATASNSPYSWNIDTTNYSSGVYMIKVVSDNDNSIYAESQNFVLTKVLVSSIEILNLVSNSLEIGQTIDIQWTATNITGNVSILLYQNGTALNTIGSTLGSVSNVIYFWNIDANSYSAGVNYTIRVISDNDGSIYDESDPFSIVDPPPPPNTSFAFFDDFSDGNIKISPNINDDISGILPSSYHNNLNYAWHVDGGWTPPEALEAIIEFQTNWPPMSNSNVARVDLENIIDDCSSVTGDFLTPLKLEMDFNAYVGSLNSLGIFYQNANLNCRYGFELYDADNELYVTVYVDSYSQELKIQINATQSSPGVFISPSEDFGSMGNAPVGFLSPFTSITLEYNGSSFKISSPNSNDINYSVGNQHYTNINFETIGFYFYLDYALNNSPNTYTYFDNVSLSGLRVPAKKGVKKNASFLRSNNRNIKIPFKK
jgi:hypothetical protein